jgi:hypothetical protein
MTRRRQLIDWRVRGAPWSTLAEREKIGLAELRAFALLVGSLISPLPVAADSLPRSVLYIEQTDPGTPFSAAVAANFRSNP